MFYEYLWSISEVIVYCIGGGGGAIGFRLGASQHCT